MPQALGQAVSTLVVQELYLWLNLAVMRDVNKVHFLDAPISQGGMASSAPLLSPAGSGVWFKDAAPLRLCQ